jgi:hypothetical protein
MRIAMSLLVRDEADLVDAWLRYHLTRGVDVVLVTDHGSTDGTSEILAEHARDGRVVVHREDAGVLRQSEWVTRMSRVLATEHGADWVMPSDADELWWPRGGSFVDVFASVPARFGVVRALMRQFVFRPGEGPPLERMTARARPSADLGSPYHAQVKVAHRGVADAKVGVGNHDVEGRGLRVLREWFPIEVLHFPIRSEAQLADKFQRRRTSPDGQHIVQALDLLGRGRLDVLVAQTLVDDEALAAGLSDGSLVEDVRLRDAIRALHAHGRLPADPVQTLEEDADLAVDAHVALELDGAAIAERRCAELERVVAVLEGRRSLPVRIGRRLRRSPTGSAG